MARAVVWSWRARSDARLALEFIRKESPQAARRFAQALVAAAQSLAEFSKRGREVPELANPDVRELLLSRYRLVYEVLPDRVAVVRIIHASREFRSAWDRQGA